MRFLSCTSGLDPKIFSYNLNKINIYYILWHIGTVPDHCESGWHKSVVFPTSLEWSRHEYVAIELGVRPDVTTRPLVIGGGSTHGSKWIE